MATGCESRRGGHSQTPRPGRGHGDEWIDCVGSMNASPRPVDDCLLLSKSVPVIPRYGTKCAPSSCGRRGLKKRQKPLRVIFLPTLACRDRSQIIDLDRGSGHRSCTCTVNPKNFFLMLVCQPFYISRVSLFLFFSPDSSVAQTLKNVEPLDCKFRLLASATLPWRQDFGLGGHALVDFERFPSELSCGFSCCFFPFLFFFFHSFSLLLSFFLSFFCGDLELFFF